MHLLCIYYVFIYLFLYLFIYYSFIYLFIILYNSGTSEVLGFFAQFCTAISQKSPCANTENTAVHTYRPIPVGALRLESIPVEVMAQFGMMQLRTRGRWHS